MSSPAHHLRTTIVKVAHDQLLRRIQATTDLPTHRVRAGDLGGWISENATLDPGAWIAENAMVLDHVQILDQARVSGKAVVGQQAIISGHAIVCDQAQVRDRAQVGGQAYLTHHCRVTDHAYVSGNAQICGHAHVHGHARITGHAWVSHHARVGGSARVIGRGLIRQDQDLLTLGPLGEDNRLLHAHRTREGHLITDGCWVSTLDQLPWKIDPNAQSRNTTATDATNTTDTTDTTEPQKRWIAEYRLITELIALRVAAWDTANAALNQSTSPAQDTSA